MEIRTNFEFNNVGQGLFYSGEIIGDKFEFFIVYDCGTFSRKSFIEREVQRVRKKIENTAKKINLLVISHFDADHVNGIASLLAKMQVDTVIIPYIIPLYRLAIAAKYPNEKKDYYSFMSNPVKFLTDRGVKNIILLGGSSPSEENKVDLNPENNPNDNNLLINKLLDDNNLKRSFTEDPNYEKDILNNKFVHIKSHNGYLFLRQFWYFRFFNYKVSGCTILEFKQALSNSNIDISTISKIRELIMRLDDKKTAKKIKACYKKIYSDINETSIIMYHGPLGNPKNYNLGYFNYKYIYHFKYIRFEFYVRYLFSYFSNIIAVKTESGQIINSNLYGTMLLGDINLNKRFNEIMMHFQESLKRTQFILVPHHGSRISWNSKLIERTSDKAVWIYSAGINRKKHPSKSVIDCFRCLFPPKLLLWSNELNRITFKSYYEWK